MAIGANESTAMRCTKALFEKKCAKPLEKTRNNAEVRFFVNLIHVDHLLIIKMNRVILTVFIFIVLTAIFHLLRSTPDTRLYRRYSNHTFISVPHGVYELHLPKGGRRCSDDCILRSYTMD